MITALGLMSGTSLDGIDAALLTTDGESSLSFGPTATYDYARHDRDLLRAALDAACNWDHATPPPELLTRAAEVVTRTHIAAVRDFSATRQTPELIGLHGQTLVHRPAAGFSLQVGDGQRLADASGVPVISDFRQADLRAGGQGAPLAPLFHEVLVRRAGLREAAVVNIGGVANVTFVGSGPPIAFDTGPGNALLDDWAARHTGRPIDLDGALARSGQVQPDVLARMLGDPYYAAAPPKSLDRLDFSAAPLDGLSAEDGAATLTALTAESIAGSARLIDREVPAWILTGGGRRNPALLAALRARLGHDAVRVAEQVGWDGDALEAQLFGWLAVRSVRGLPLSLPSTTGVAVATCGGVRHTPGG